MNTTKKILWNTGLLHAGRHVRGRGLEALGRVLHPVRERLTRTPSPWFRMTQKPLSEPYSQYLAELKRHGVVRVSGEVSGRQLSDMKASMDRFVATLDAKARSFGSVVGDMTEADEHFDAEGRVYSSNEPFTFCRALLEVCLKPELLALINAYLGKRAYITQGVAARIEPNPHTGFGSFQWHHDAWGKRINMMVVLTELGPGDQHMTYAKGSHLLRHPYEKYVNSRFTREEFAERCAGMEVLNCYAQPGDLYIFDSNGIHSGNRSNTRARDTFIMEYTRLRHAVWAHRVPADFLTGFTQEQLSPLRWILRQDRTKRSLAPPANSWAAQLLRVDKWLR